MGFVCWFKPTGDVSTLQHYCDVECCGVGTVVVLSVVVLRHPCGFAAAPLAYTLKSAVAAESADRETEGAPRQLSGVLRDQICAT